MLKSSEKNTPILRVTGMYDLRTLDFLFESGIYHYGMDFRPRSLNFLQQYRFLEILEQRAMLPVSFSMLYADEPDFITQKMITDTAPFFNQLLTGKELLLEFSDQKKAQFYRQFGPPYLWHYKALGDFTGVINDPQAMGIVFSAQELFSDHSKANYNLLRIIYQVNFIRQKRPFQCILSIDGDKPVTTDMLNGLNFTGLTLPIDRRFEVCYRNVDLEKLGKGIGHMRRLLASMQGQSSLSPENEGRTDCENSYHQ